MFNRAYSIVANKDDLYKENVRVKQGLKESGYQESIVSKIFKRITRFFISNFTIGINVRVAQQIYVFKVKSCLGVA